MNRKGQSTLEYTLVIAAILVAIIAAATTFIKPAVTQTMQDSNSAITSASGKLKTQLQ